MRDKPHERVYRLTVETKRNSLLHLQICISFEQAKHSTTHTNRKNPHREAKRLNSITTLPTIESTEDSIICVILQVDTECKLLTGMASLLTTSAVTFSPVNNGSRGFRKSGNSSKGGCCIKAMRIEKSLEELYNVKVERKVSPERLAELGVSKWSVWKTGKGKLPWDWQVDQLVYVEEGEVRVVPQGSKRFMQFLAGDLVRYPKWFEADLWFNGPYQEQWQTYSLGAVDVTLDLAKHCWGAGRIKFQSLKGGIDPKESNPERLSDK
ncbi:hypothetical protein CR513_30875, partial [Mucuna pruriens]